MTYLTSFIHRKVIVSSLDYACSYEDILADLQAHGPALVRVDNLSMEDFSTDGKLRYTTPPSPENTKKKTTGHQCFSLEFERTSSVKSFFFSSSMISKIDSSLFSLQSKLQQRFDTASFHSFISSVNCSDLKNLSFNFVSNSMKLLLLFFSSSSFCFLTSLMILF